MRDRKEKIERRRKNWNRKNYKNKKIRHMGMLLLMGNWKELGDI